MHFPPPRIRDPRAGSPKNCRAAGFAGFAGLGYPDPGRNAGRSGKKDRPRGESDSPGPVFCLKCSVLVFGAERSALGALLVGGLIGVAAADLDGVQRAAGLAVTVVGALIDGAADAVMGMIFVHVQFLLKVRSVFDGFQQKFILRALFPAAVRRPEQMAEKISHAALSGPRP